MGVPQYFCYDLTIMGSRFSIALFVIVLSLFSAHALKRQRRVRKSAGAVETNVSPGDRQSDSSGGYVSQENAVHAEVQLANKLRGEYSPQLWCTWKHSGIIMGRERAT